MNCREAILSRGCEVQLPLAPRVAFCVRGDGFLDGGRRSEWVGHGQVVPAAPVAAPVQVANRHPAPYGPALTWRRGRPAHPRRHPRVKANGRRKLQVLPRG